MRMAFVGSSSLDQVLETWHNCGSAFQPKSRFCQIRGFLRFAQVSLGTLMRGKQYGRQPAAGSISLSCFTAFQSTRGSDQRLRPSNRRRRRCCRICNPTASRYPIIQHLNWNKEIASIVYVSGRYLIIVYLDTSGILLARGVAKLPQTACWKTCSTQTWASVTGAQSCSSTLSHAEAYHRTSDAISQVEHNRSVGDFGRTSRVGILGLFLVCAT